MNGYWKDDGGELYWKDREFLEARARQQGCTTMTDNTEDKGGDLQAPFTAASPRLAVESIEELKRRVRDNQAAAAILTGQTPAPAPTTKASVRAVDPTLPSGTGQTIERQTSGPGWS